MYLLNYKYKNTSVIVAVQSKLLYYPFDYLFCVLVHHNMLEETIYSSLKQLE